MQFLNTWFKQNLVSTLLVGVFCGIVIASGFDQKLSKPIVDLFIETCLWCYGLNVLWVMILPKPK